MNRDIVELEEHFQKLIGSRSALSAEMRATAMRLRDSGAVPTEELDRAFDDYRASFAHLRAGLGLISLDEYSESEPKWDDLHHRLGVCREAAGAKERLRVADRLSVPAGQEALLDPVRQASCEVIDRLETNLWSEMDLIHEIQESRHPLCRLVSLVERLDGLSDDEWTREMAAVQQSFGVPLSTAIARGKVVLADSK